MQTFLPYPDFVQTAKCLDYRRLGKQRSEARTILTHLEKGMGPWWNHPAVQMWRGCEGSLIIYSNCIISEWIGRGYNNNMKLLPEPRRLLFPKWLGDEAFHNSHKSNLLRKDPRYYGQFGWDVPDNLPYVWPKPEV